jgi:hypothetical protein
MWAQQIQPLQLKSMLDLYADKNQDTDLGKKKETKMTKNDIWLAFYLSLILCPSRTTKDIVRWHVLLLLTALN